MGTDHLDLIQLDSVIEAERLALEKCNCSAQCHAEYAHNDSAADKKHLRPFLLRYS
jgi:hypothetical protein